MAETQDTEITLGTGKLLGIFFVITAVCGVFFVMGYLLGRSSSPGSGSTTIVSAVPSNGNPANKPSAGNGSKPADAPQQNASNPESGSYAPVTIRDKDAGANQQPVTLIVPKSSDAAPDASSSPASAAKSASTGSYMVQVAAVTKQEDADLLVSALRKKEYPVFVATTPGDSLFHVQVGPFSDSKDAEAMRSRLAGDGYNAIVKK